MARPIYPHELADPDFQWLVSTYKENNSVSFTVEGSCLPVVLIKGPAPAPDVTDIGAEEGAGLPVVADSQRLLKDEPEYS